MRLRIVLAVIGVLALAAGATAQTTTGTISGRVLDTQGAALPGAIAWSVAACRAPGTRMPVVTPRDVAAVTVQPAIDRSRILVR